MSSIADLTTGKRVFAVTPSDTASIAGPEAADNIPVALYVGVAGDVAVKCYQDDAVTFKSCPAGSYVLCSPTRVMSTNTTATNIVAIYNRV